MNIQQLTGVSKNHTERFSSDFAWCDENLRVHKEIVTPLHKLCKFAFDEGHKLALLSGYRSYHRQVQIWEMKNSGKKKILDDNGVAIYDFDSDQDRFNKIARWSALPGISRHHWGTDIDVFSADAIESGYQVELVEKEFNQSGPCEKLNHWMRLNLEKFSFYRPYQIDKGGVAPEPWHISFQPLSTIFHRKITSNNLMDIWNENPWCGSNWACRHSETLFDKYYS